jgi:hypothetical protein
VRIESENQIAIFTESKKQLTSRLLIITSRLLIIGTQKRWGFFASDERRWANEDQASREDSRKAQSIPKKTGLPNTARFDSGQSGICFFPTAMQNNQGKKGGGRMKITGTLKELDMLFAWEKLCKLINVDYYNRHLVSDDEVFNIELKLDSQQEVETANLHLPEE